MLAAYRRLVDACARPGCPVCRCVREAAIRHLQGLLAEHVTDPATRRRLAAAWGFCAVHAAALRGIADAALGTAIVYEGLLARAVAWLDRAAPPAAGGAGGWRALVGRRRRPAAPPRPRRGRCPVCVELAATERSHLDTLVAAVGDRTLGVALAGSAGLCLPHVELALQRARGRPEATRLAAVARGKLERLAGELRGFIDKHDHRVTPRFTDGEAEAWSSALGIVAGAPEVFGLELERETGRRSAPGSARGVDG